MSFSESYNKIKTLVQPELSQVEIGLLDLKSTSNKSLDESLANILKAPSKRLRPLISFLFLKAFNTNIEDSHIDVQIAVELVHNASLVHDDIIDNSDLRRNEKTVNAKFDNSLAVVAGDFLLTLAINKILKLNNSRILEVFSNAMQKMCVGEVSQYFSKFKMIDIENYIEKSAQKTASLFEAAIVSSAILSGLNTDLARDFANNFGIAFQIRDDILNFKTDDLKPTKNDFEQGIYTAPILFAGDIKNIDSGIEKSMRLLDNYLSKCENLIINADDNIYKKAILEMLELFKLCN